MTETGGFLDGEEDAKPYLGRGVSVLARRATIARQDSCEGYEQTNEPQLPFEGMYGI